MSKVLNFITLRQIAKDDGEMFKQSDVITRSLNKKGLKLQELNNSSQKIFITAGSGMHVQDVNHLLSSSLRFNA